METIELYVDKMILSDQIVFPIPIIFSQFIIIIIIILKTTHIYILIGGDIKFSQGGPS